MAPLLAIIRNAAAASVAIGHPDAFRTLVLDDGWDAERWAAWARATLDADLLAPHRRR